MLMYFHPKVKNSNHFPHESDLPKCSLSHSQMKINIENIGHSLHHRLLFSPLQIWGLSCSEPSFWSLNIKRCLTWVMNTVDSRPWGHIQQGSILINYLHISDPTKMTWCESRLVEEFNIIEYYGFLGCATESNCKVVFKRW